MTTTITVINMWGTEIYYDAAVLMMDEDICEALANEGFETEQEFFTAYEIAHMEQYGEEWELSKVSPQY